MSYILAVDQSTQGTKIALFDKSGCAVYKNSRPHRQIIDENGFVSHDAEEIYNNLIGLVGEMLKTAPVSANDIKAVGITNQRETSLMWDKTGKPLAYAVVWQCKRGESVTAKLTEYAETVKQKTGLPLSPYFSAAKFAWLLKNAPHADDIRLGTVDSWLIYKLTNAKSFVTDYSNAARTQLFNVNTLKWDDGLCKIFDIQPSFLPDILDSDALFGYTDFEGLLDHAIPILSDLGDSNAALYAQNCVEPGCIKATYGTGSSVMMNVGKECKICGNGISTSLGWKLDNQIVYVFEGNINYSGAIISWLKNDLELINDESEIDALLLSADKDDTSVLVPAFSGLSAPYWDNNAKAVLCGMTRLTGKAEIVAAAIKSIAFQVCDVVHAMDGNCSFEIKELKADGGASSNKYLMQKQSDFLNIPVKCAREKDLSLWGAARIAGKNISFFENAKINDNGGAGYFPASDNSYVHKELAEWENAVKLALSRKQ